MGDYENKHMPQRNRTYSRIWADVKSGKLKRRKCRVCGATKTQAHHTGAYSAGKNIVWLCDKHHRAAHVRKRSGKGYKKSMDIEIVKQDGTKRLVYLIVVKPRVPDTDQQWFEPEDVELVAHRFMVRHILGDAHIFEEHSKQTSGVFVTESYIAPADFVLNEREVKQGTWVVVMWVPNDDIWEKIQKGELRGASPRGPAKLFPGQVPQQAHDASTHDRFGTPAAVR